MVNHWPVLAEDPVGLLLLDDQPFDRPTEDLGVDGNEVGGQREDLDHVGCQPEGGHRDEPIASRMQRLPFQQTNEQRGGGPGRAGPASPPKPRPSRKRRLTTAGHSAARSGRLASVDRGSRTGHRAVWTRPAGTAPGRPALCGARKTHQVLGARFAKAAKAELACLKASCWVYPAGK